MSQKDQYGLTPKQRRFCDYYLADPERNATQAYLKAYPKSARKSAQANAARMMGNDMVAAYIDKVGRRGADKAAADAERVILEMARIGLSDVRRLFDDDGRLLDIRELDDDTAAAISSVEVMRKMGDDDETETVTKIKFWPKTSALEQLGKVHGLFREKLELTGGGLVDLMLAEHKRRKSR